MTTETLEKKYSNEFDHLRVELETYIASQNFDDSTDVATLDPFLECNALDDKLTKYVVLYEATPKGLAEFAIQGSEEAALIDQLLSDSHLQKEMLLADGAMAVQQGKNNNFTGRPAHYGPAMKIFTSILHESEHARVAKGCFLQRLALAIALQHAVPLTQDNPQIEGADFDDKYVDPIRRYLNYEMAYLDGELDPLFDTLTTWECRMVVDGEEPDETLAWGREMLRNYRPDHIFCPNYAWRYVGMVNSNIRYGSQDVKHDRPELQQYQNILMNGGVCGRRAFFGRFILRAFGIPTTARPSPGHGSLVHWTPQDYWVANLGGNFGCGWTKTRYKKDSDFLSTAKARTNHAEYWKVKRAQWFGDVLGEQRIYGENDQQAATHLKFWYGVSLKVQKAIIEKLPEKNPPCAFVNNNRKLTIAERVLATPAAPDAKKILYDKPDKGVITIPAAAYNNPGRTTDVTIMTSFSGDYQIYLPPFKPQGLTIMRGGTWKMDADVCSSGKRILSGGYGKYEDWGFRVAISGGDGTDGECCPNERLTIDLGNDGRVPMEFSYIKPGVFIMGGESTKDGRFECVEVPKHQVQITKGFYLGKYPVTQAQYDAVMGTNPSKSTKAPDCPVDNIGENDADDFCNKLVEIIGKDFRLPTEAEWEYACRAGQGDHKWFFGDDPSQMGEYAWFKDNSSGKSHPVGQKKPNPFGLYDTYGNVFERVSDKYDKNYYANSPPVDPTGPSQGIKSSFEYKIKIPKAGKYSLVAESSYSQ